MPNLFAKNLKYLRVQSGETQAGMAVHVGKGQTTIGNWETGVSQPSIDELLLLSNFFGVEPGDLIAADLTNDQASIVREAGTTYGNSTQDVLQQKDMLISALNGQVEALKMIITQMQARLDAMEKGKKA